MLLMKKSSLAVICLGLMFSVPLKANETVGFLKSLYVDKQGTVLVKLTNPLSNKPKCANNPDWDFKFSMKDESSLPMFEMVKMAYSSSKPLRIGYGAEASCGKGFPAVNVEYVYFTNIYQNKNLNKGNYKTTN